jgi:hypothetical protein
MAEAGRPHGRLSPGFSFAWTVRDADGEIGVVGDGLMYHATRERHVPRILQEGLRTGAVAHGILDRWGVKDVEHWSDEFYGKRPVYLLTEKSIPRTYGWERHDQEEPDTTVLLEVDATGLRLLPDLVTFENPHHVLVLPDGIGWWSSYLATKPDPDQLPPQFVRYANDSGIIPYAVLVTDAAATAIAYTRTAAVLEDIPASRVSQGHTMG